MQASQVRTALPHIEQCIDHAAQLCQINRKVSDEIRHCLSELDRESGQVQQMLEQEPNEQHIAALIDRLEMLGDRAMQACQQAGTVDEDMHNAVRQAHAAISDLKHRLH